MSIICVSTVSVGLPNKADQSWFRCRQDPSGTMGPYAYGGNQWVGYDDAAMVAAKTRWAVSQGFGAVMVWDVNSEDVK